MAQQHINSGSAPNDGTGDTLRVSQIKSESNFNELYSGKVNVVLGKVLSDTNYTQAEKDQLATLVSAGPSVQSDMTEGNPLSPAFIKNKFTNTSDFNNDGDGTQPFIIDTGAVGHFVRSQGQWINNSIKIFDGIIGVTAGLIIGQQTFTLPVRSVCVNVYLSHAKQYKTTANNASLVNRWSQSGNDVIITKTPVLNNYIYIEFL